MPTGPKIRLAVDLHRIDKYFPLDYNTREGFDFDMVIDRDRYDEVNALLNEYAVSDDRIIREFCFILLWIEKETRAGKGQDDTSGKFYQMWLELDSLQDYLLKNRITSVIFRGESGRKKPSEELTISEDINIDRLCDGIRSIFRDEFHHDRQRRQTKGLKAWQKRKMIRVRNHILNYFTAIPVLDDLSLEDQNHLIDRLSEMAGLPGAQI